VPPIELANVLAKFLGKGVRMTIMGDSSPLHGVQIGPPFGLFCLRSGPLTRARGSINGLRRESQSQWASSWTDRTAALAWRSAGIVTLIEARSGSGALP